MKKIWSDPEYRDHMSKVHMGKIGYWTGKKRSQMTGEKNYFYGKNLSGEQAWHWKGENALQKDVRNDPAYKQWRLKVLRRDDYRCMFCGEVKKGKMEADHINLWKNYPKLRYDINNGQTLCRECHVIKTQYELRKNTQVIFAMSY